PGNHGVSSYQQHRSSGDGAVAAWVAGPGPDLRHRPAHGHAGRRTAVLLPRLAAGDRARLWALLRERRAVEAEPDAALVSGGGVDSYRGDRIHLQGAGRRVAQSVSDRRHADRGRTADVAG